MSHYDDFAHFTIDQLKQHASGIGITLRGQPKRETIIDKIIEESQKAIEIEPIIEDTPIHKVEQVKHQYIEKETVVQSGTFETVKKAIDADWKKKRISGQFRIDPDVLVKIIPSPHSDNHIRLIAVQHPTVITEVLLLQPMKDILQEVTTFYNIATMQQLDPSKIKEGQTQQEMMRRQTVGL